MCAVGLRSWRLLKRGAASGALVLAALAALILAGPVSPAAAHDVIKAAEPADGSVVAAVPATIRLTFNNPPIAPGSKILVKDENGTNQSDGPVVIVDNHVSQAVKSSVPAGRYTMVWRVVSSDSHPIEGTFLFTAGAGAGQPGTAPGTASPAPAPKPSETAAFPWGLAAGGAVLAAGLVTRAIYVRRQMSGSHADGQP